MSSYRATVRRAVAMAGMGALLGASSAVAGTGVGAVMHLGETNTVNARTTLAGSVDAAQLRVDNSSTGATAAGVAINVAPGRPPLRVNASAGKATNLNADRLDGRDASAFLPANGVALNAERLGGLTASDFVQGHRTRISNFRRYLDIHTGVSPNLPIPLSVWYRCRGDSYTHDTVELYNPYSNTYVDYWADDGIADPEYGVIAGAQRVTFDMRKAGERLSLWLGTGEAKASEVTVVSVNIGSNCLVQVHASGPSY